MEDYHSFKLMPLAKRVALRQITQDGRVAALLRIYDKSMTLAFAYFKETFTIIMPYNVNVCVDSRIEIHIFFHYDLTYLTKKSLMNVLPKSRARVI